MLELNLEGKKFFEEETGRLLYIDGGTLKLEHSLISISKWESKWKKSFLDSKDKTTDEILDYIKCMTLNSVPQSMYLLLGNDEFEKIAEYINDTKTATVINDKSPNRRGSRGRRKRTVTSELIYSWMVTCGIPFECEKWHINRLLTLIQVCEVEQAPPKKMSKRDILAQNSAINDARLKKYHSKG